VTQGLRTWEEQDALYAKGRSVAPLGKKYFVTMAKGGQSYHNFGLAFDIVVLDSVGKADWDPSHAGWKEAAVVGKSLGLEWGGDWKTFKDLPHFQYIGGLPLKTCCELYPSGLPAVWQRVV
jgi:peptidoglycan LD-endopeptidase CwlK